MNKRLIILAKRPVLGFVKTRLAKQVGPEMALRIYERMLNKVLGLASQGPSVVYWTGQGDTPLVECSKEQSEGDLGQRMLQAVESELGSSAMVVVIGTDCPELRGDHISLVFSLLQNHDVVIGPAHDGGYYLIGMKVAERGLFDDMPWSTSNVFSITLERCRLLRLAVATLPVMHDLDEWTDIENQADRQWLLHDLK